MDHPTLSKKNTCILEKIIKITSILSCLFLKKKEDLDKVYKILNCCRGDNNNYDNKKKK